MLEVEISVNIEIFLFIIIFIFTKQIALYGVFILFTLIHELTHMIVGILLGLKLKKITVLPFGFNITFNETNYDKNKKMIVIIAGPLINLIIMAISIIFKLHRNIIYANLVIVIFNLIPIYPLDGGRILKLYLSKKIEKVKLLKITNQISNISIVILTALSSILILYIKNIGIIFILVYLWYLVIKENKRYKIKKRVYEVIENNK